MSRESKDATTDAYVENKVIFRSDGVGNEQISVFAGGVDAAENALTVAGGQVLGIISRLL